MHVTLTSIDAKVDPRFLYASVAVIGCMCIVVVMKWPVERNLSDRISVCHKQVLYLTRPIRNSWDKIDLI